MKEYPPQKPKVIMRKCIDKMKTQILSTLNDTCDEFPDVEENKVILVNSVLSAVISEILLLRTHDLSATERRRYIRDILNNINSVTLEVILGEIKNELT